jgi:hypothetical protein
MFHCIYIVKLVLRTVAARLTMNTGKVTIIYIYIFLYKDIKTTNQGWPSMVFYGLVF